MLFPGDTEATVIHFTKLKTLDKKGDETGDGTTGGGRSASAATNNSDNNRHGNKQGASGFLRVTAPTFDLSMTASAARRISPCLVLATGERGDADSKDGPWLHRKAGGGGGGGGQDEGTDRSNGGAAVGFLARGSARPGSRNPAWKDGEFWLSVEGLEEPALFLALEDGKKVQQREREQNSEGKGRGGGSVSEEAIIAEACIPLPLEAMRGGKSGGGGFGRRGSRSSGTFEVELSNGAGVASLQWSAHEDTSSMRTHR